MTSPLCLPSDGKELAVFRIIMSTSSLNEADKYWADRVAIFIVLFNRHIETNVPICTNTNYLLVRLRVYYFYSIFTNTIARIVPTQIDGAWVIRDQNK